MSRQDLIVGEHLISCQFVQLVCAGLSFLVGVTGGIDTFCSQTHGAGTYRQVSLHLEICQAGWACRSRFKKEFGQRPVASHQKSIGGCCIQVMAVRQMGASLQAGHAVMLILLFPMNPIWSYCTSALACLTNNQLTCHAGGYCPSARHLHHPSGLPPCASTLHASRPAAGALGARPSYCPGCGAVHSPVQPGTTAPWSGTVYLQIPAGAGESCACE